MKSFYLFLILFMALANFAAAQGAAEQKAAAGGSISIQISNIPSSDIGIVSREYTVDRDGTIKMAHLSKRLHVAGRTQRQVEDMVTSAYVSQEIYTKPVVQAIIGRTKDLDQQFIHLTGKVNSQRNMAYREGITLIEAIVDCGGLSDHGSRQIQITRNGKSRIYDFFSTRDRSIKLLPGDQIHVLDRGAFEGRPSSLVP